MTEPQAAPDRISDPGPVNPAPAKPRRLLIALGLAALAVVLLVAGAAVYLLRNDGSVDRWGQKSDAVAKKLHICDSPTMYGTAAACTTVDGDRVVVTTSGDQDTQDFLVAMIKDQGSAGCMVVAKGYVISAPSSAALTSAIGIPERFAAQHHGYLVCPAG